MLCEHSADVVHLMRDLNLCPKTLRFLAAKVIGNHYRFTRQQLERLTNRFMWEGRYDWFPYTTQYDTSANHLFASCKAEAERLFAYYLWESGFRRVHLKQVPVMDGHPYAFILYSKRRRPWGFPTDDADDPSFEAFMSCLAGNFTPTDLKWLFLNHVVSQTKTFTILEDDSVPWPFDDLTEEPIPSRDVVVTARRFVLVRNQLIRFPDSAEPEDTGGYRAVWGRDEQSGRACVKYWIFRLD